MKPFLNISVLLGSISFALMPLKSNLEQYKERLKANHLKFDRDKNGVLSQEELSTSWKKLRYLDSNKDEQISQKELQGLQVPAINSPGEKLLCVPYKTVNGTAVYLDFYYPDVDDKTDKPVVVFTHGGGWAAGNKSKAGQGLFNRVHRALLNKGFCVLSVGYRLAKPGRPSGVRDCVIDVQDAVRFAVAHQKALGISPEKIYTFGDSAGGHLAQMLLWCPADKLQGDPELAPFTYKTVAGVSWYGPCDFQDIQLFNFHNEPDFRNRFSGRILQARPEGMTDTQLYQEVSPVIYAHKSQAPLFMIQGDQDTTIPVNHVHRMQEVAQETGAPVRFQVVKNAGHNWRAVNAPISPTTDEIVQMTVDYFLGHF